MQHKENNLMTPWPSECGRAPQVSITLRSTVLQPLRQLGPARAHAVSLLYPSLCDPVDCGPQASLSMGFSRQGHWSGLHALLQGIFSTQRLNPRLLCLLLLQVGSLPQVPITNLVLLAEYFPVQSQWLPR